jgi:hypothetical protein
MVFNKALAPVISLGLAAVLAVAVSMKIPLKHGQWMLTIAPVVVAGVGVFITMRFWSFMDEVYDCGEYLLARRGREEAVILLGDILAVSESRGRGVVIELLLETGGPFGREVKFVPRQRTATLLRPFAHTPLYLDLRERIAAAKAKRSGGSSDALRDT